MADQHPSLALWQTMDTPAYADADGRFAAIGIDIGSTTAKLVVFCDGKLVYSCYERHFSQVRPKTLELLLRVRDMVGDRPVKAAISGSAGFGMADAAGIPFVQEVVAALKEQERSRRQIEKALGRGFVDEHTGA